MKQQEVDQIADISSVLYNKTRRDIRDLLRNSDPLTLTEIAKSIGHSEQNIHHHLTILLENNIITKEYGKLNNRNVSLYSISGYYDELFSRPIPDITPLAVLFVLYGLFTVISFAYIQLLTSILPLSKSSIMLASSSGFVVTAVIMAIYIIVYRYKVTGNWLGER